MDEPKLNFKTFKVKLYKLLIQNLGKRYSISPQAFDKLCDEAVRSVFAEMYERSGRTAANRFLQGD